MVYVDDLSGAFLGDRKFLNLLIWVLAFEVAGSPFGYNKFSGGLSVAFLGYQLQYDACQAGIYDRRGRWLFEWIDEAQADSLVVVSRDFSEFLGRLGFVSQVLVWIKPHLSPLYAWSFVCLVGGNCFGNSGETSPDGYSDDVVFEATTCERFFHGQC